MLVDNRNRVNLLRDSILRRSHRVLPFSPLEFNLDLWLDVRRSILTLSGTDVITVGDKSNTGADFTIGTSPVVDSASDPTKITFTAANSEFLENALDVAKFATMSQGSVVYISGVNNFRTFVVSNSTVNNVTFRVGVSTGVAFLFMDDNGVQLFLRSTALVGNDKIIEWKTDGIVWRVFIDGLEDTVNIIGGSNNGQFLSSLSGLDALVIGADLSSVPSFSDNTFKAIILRSTPFTDVESLQLSNYLIANHNL